MRKQLLRILTIAVLSVFIISTGLTSFAAIKEPDVSIQWTHINTTGNLFEIVDETTNYDVFACGGITTVAINKYAYVKVELQYLEGGVWKTYATWEDEGHMQAVVDEDIQVTPGYSYQLLLTHKAKDANGNTLETFNDRADHYLTSLPRS